MKRLLTRHQWICNEKTKIAYFYNSSAKIPKNAQKTQLSHQTPGFFRFFGILLTNHENTFSWYFHYIFNNIWTVIQNFLKLKYEVELTLKFQKETRAKKKLFNIWHDSDCSAHLKLKKSNHILIFRPAPIAGTKIKS